MPDEGAYGKGIRNPTDPSDQTDYFRFDSINA
jgi:hypothetical protein